MLALPRAPLTHSMKSGREDRPDNYAAKMYQMAGDLREQAISERKLDREFENIPKYIAALMGDQHSRMRPKYRSSFVDNRLAKARVESKAYLTDVNPTIDISTFVPDYTKQAKMIQNFIHSEWRRTNMDLRLAETVDHANFGIGYGRMGALMPGELIYKAFGMDCILPIQRGDHIQTASAVLYRSHKPIQYFVKMFPGRTDGLERFCDAAMSAMSTNQYQRPGHVDEYTWNVMSPAMKYKLGVQLGKPAPVEGAPFPTCELEEFWIDDPAINETKDRILIRNPYLSVDAHNYWYWVNPGQPLWPRKRLVIFGGESICVYDGPSPYWHGLYPFGELILDPIVWGPGGLSRYRTLLPINQGINEMNAGIFDAAKRNMNQALIAKRGAVTETAFDKFYQDQPGAKLYMTPGSNPATDLRYGPTVDLPGWTPQFLKHLYECFERQSGGVDSLGLKGKKQVPAADVIQSLKDSQSGQYRLEGRYVEAFLGDLGPQAVSNVLQFVTRDKRISMFGPDGVTKFDFDFRPGDAGPWGQPRESHWKNFAVQIAPGSLHGGSKDADQNKWATLYRLGAISLQELHRRLEIQDSEKILKEIAMEHQAGVGGGGGGRPRPQRSSGQKKGATV